MAALTAGSGVFRGAWGRVLLAAVLLLGLMACSFQSSRSSSAPRRLEESAQKPPPGYALVYFYRVGVNPETFVPEVTVDDAAIYDAQEGYYTFVYIHEGVKRFQIQWEDNPLWPPKDLVVRLEEGKTYYFKINGLYQTGAESKWLDESQGARISLTEDQKWQKREMEYCCYRYQSPESETLE